MPLLFLLIFIAVPIVEIVLLIQVGQILGWIPTILIVILTAVVGTTLLRQQGFGVMARAAEALAEGRMPVEHVLEGACLLVAGAFLLTPGLLTDTVGFLLLVPPIRVAVAKGVLSRLLKSGYVHVQTAGGRPGAAGGARADGDNDPRARSGSFRSQTRTHRGTAGGPVIEGDYERVDEDDDNLGDGGKDRHGGR